MSTTDIVAKLWSLCHVLRDDGITYHQYVNELTFLLFLKMAAETGKQDDLPAGYRWADLKALQGLEQLNFYRRLLLHLGTHGNERVQAIFADANTALREPRNLAKLVTDIDTLDWFDAREEGLAEMYEGLLEKNANEKKSGAGQYFTPRPLIETMVALVDPQVGEVISDPAAGTLGFITRAWAHMKPAIDKAPQAKQDWQRREGFYAVELVPDARRLALMASYLHGLECDVRLGDTLSSEGVGLPRSNVILTNPPFGTKKGGGQAARSDFTFPTSNKQLAFLQHIYRNLVPGGRAAVVLPDNVLFEDGMGRQIRADLMDKCRLHTILRLPTGIFYAQGVKTNVLFFERGAAKDTGNTTEVWVYDLRANMPSFGKRTPFTRGALAPFEAVYPWPRVDEGEAGRFRRFTRAQIAARGENLDISWLRDENAERAEDLAEPEVLAGEIMGLLRTAMGEMEGLLGVLEGGE